MTPEILKMHITCTYNTRKNIQNVTSLCELSWTSLLVGLLVGWSVVQLVMSQFHKKAPIVRLVKSQFCPFYGMKYATLYRSLWPWRGKLSIMFDELSLKALTFLELRFFLAHSICCNVSMFVGGAVEWASYWFMMPPNLNPAETFIYLFSLSLILCLCLSLSFSPSSVLVYPRLSLCYCLVL